jgi:phosphoribosyl 1,2-cyclic phosphodiesterase
LIDAGLGPRRLEQALADAGASWDDVRAVLLTHTHGDHCRGATLKLLARRRIPLYCHGRHQAALQAWTGGIALLEESGLVGNFELGRPFTLGPMTCRPFAVPHDDAPTCGFRFQGDDWAVGYAADFGSWSRDIVGHLRDVDILAVEFNHDVALQQASGRTPWLIARNLGRHGHLSNVQAAALVQAVLRQSQPGRLRHLVQLHLSEQCNTPELARASATAVVGGLATIHTGAAWLALKRRAAVRHLLATKMVQAFLPGWEEELAG